MSGWYKRGDEIKDDDFKSSNQINRQLPEFWLAEGKEHARKILFLDDPNFFVKRITLKVRDEFKTFTSLGDECPAVAAGYYPTSCLAFTVLDLTPFTDKKGNERKYSKKLFLARGKATKEILDDRRSTCGGTLVGVQMKVMRLGDKSSRSGSDFQVVARTDLKKLNIPAEDLKPFDYMELLQPPTIAQIEAVMKYAAPPQGKKSKTVSRDSLSDSDPFASASDDLGAKGINDGPVVSQEPQFSSEEEIPF